MNIKNWVLPTAIDEVLPSKAWQLEQIRHRILDYFHCSGYDLVIPPIIEYLDSLLTGAGQDLALHTYKMTDQNSGRSLGFRADITSQVARIDAHRLSAQSLCRLCYAGEVIHTRSDDLAGTRNPIQIGAELYGYAGICADIEIISLMVETLEISGLSDISLDLGHVGIFRALAQQAKLDKTQEQQIFDALQRKAIPEIQTLLAQMDMSQDSKEMLMALARLNGHDIIENAKEQLANAPDSVHQALSDIAEMIQFLAKKIPNIPLYIDLAELRGYRFHTGMVFAAYVPQVGREIARGGRYNGIGSAFGKPRPATGFSTDLKRLLSLSQITEKPRPLVFAPADLSDSLNQKITKLRQSGYRVIRQLPDQPENATIMGCNYYLKEENKQWELIKV